MSKTARVYFGVLHPEQHLHPIQKLSLSGLDNGRPIMRELHNGGGEGLKVAGREDLEPENLGISNLISSE